MAAWPTEIDLTAHIRAGDVISWSHAGAEPVTLISRFLEQRHRFGGPVGVFLTGVTFTDILKPKHADVIRFRGIGGLTVPRALGMAGKLETLPRRYHDLPRLIRDGLLPVQVQLVTVSPPDADDFVSLGVTVALTNDILAQARVTIAEINPNMPRIGGDTKVHIDRFAAAIWSDRPLVLGPHQSPTHRRQCARSAPTSPA